MRRLCGLTLLLLAIGTPGCHHPSVTAVSLAPHYCDHKFAFLYDPCKEPEGIPFYMPKPLLIVAKNFRNIEETKVGLTDSAPIPNYFDDQSKYADLNARTNFAGLDGNNAGVGQPTASDPQQFPTAPATNLATTSKANFYSPTGAPVSPSPAATPSDGLNPNAFYTYHIIFVPDLTQKYGLQVKGGVGEFRAAMNLVNGWQFTGLGPYYMKDSSTAQNTLAGGITANLAASGVADVVKAVAGLSPTATSSGATKTGVAPPVQLSPDAAKVKALANALQQLQPKFVKIQGYSEISIYEPYLSPEGTMEWRLLMEKQFDRDVMQSGFDSQQVLNLLGSSTTPVPAAAAPASAVPAPPLAAPAAPAAPAPPRPAPPATAPVIPGSASAPTMLLPLPPGPGVSRTPPRGAAKADDALVRTQVAMPSTTPADQGSIANALGMVGSGVPSAMPLQAVVAEASGPASAVPVVTTAATVQSDLLRYMFSPSGLLGTAQGAAPPRGTLPVTPVPAPSAANQVNLNQYFGNTRVGAPGAANSDSRFSLFHHHKTRPTTRTINLSGLSQDVAAPGTAQSTLTAPTSTLPAAPTVIPGTGTGNVPPRPPATTSAAPTST